MNYEMFYIIGVCLATVFLGVLIKYAFKKRNIKASDVIENIDTANNLIALAKSALINMNFGEEKEIETVSQSIIQALNYIKDITEDISKEDKVKKATAYSIKICSDLGIRLDKNRILIINNVIKSSYNLLE